jgi:hypothetical protein
MNWIDPKLSFGEEIGKGNVRLITAQLDLKGQCNSAKMEVSQTLHPELGTITEVVIQAETTNDLTVALSALKSDYGSPDGVKKPSNLRVDCLWTKPLASWPTRIQSESNEKILEEISLHELTKEESILLSSIILLFQMYPNTIRVAGYVLCQVHALPENQQKRIIETAFAIRKTTTPNQV